MNLKARLEKLETKAPIDNKDMCIFIVGVSTNDETMIAGYRHDNDVYMRLEGESNDELHKRVELESLSKTAQNNCGIKIAIAHSISDNQKLNKGDL